MTALNRCTVTDSVSAWLIIIIIIIIIIGSIRKKRRGMLSVHAHSVNWPIEQ